MAEDTTPPEGTPPTVQATPAAAPGGKTGSGQFAVWDHDLGQFVSGVSSKADADKSRKALSSHNGAITDGHKLSTIEV